MSRRLLRVVSSSDDEPPSPPQEFDEDDDINGVDIESNFQTVNLNSSSSSNPNRSSNGTHPTEQIPLDISDEDENADKNTTTGTANDSDFYYPNAAAIAENPINAILAGLGLRLKNEWIESCLNGLGSVVMGLDDASKAKLCFGQFLYSDMNSCGAGVLPPSVHALNSVNLKGPFVLQVDEIVNINCPLRDRYQNAAAGSKRCLKLSMTDGIQRVFGMEYRSIKDLDVLSPAGFKVVICNVNVSRGLLMLVPEVIEVLGGTVEELEAARQRLVNEVNKPPRGRRNRNGELPPLSTRATLAAWPSCNNIRPGDLNRSTIENTIPQQESRQETPVAASLNNQHGHAFAVPVGRNNADPNAAFSPPPQEPGVAAQGNTTLSYARQRKEFRAPLNKSKAEPVKLSVPQSARHGNDEPMAEVATPSRVTGQVTTENIPGEDINISVIDNNPEPSISSAAAMDAEEILILDELEHPFIFSGDKEIPFTYLVSLSAKCFAMPDETSVVRGKIKCFLTGVKGFQYKQRTTYELRVYVDDGSLISEIIIDHNVVQKGIGYSPQEVTSALTSSDARRASEMKETLKQFQMLLVNFEGTMVIEMKKASLIPVAVEMNQGCLSTDACLLLKRLQNYYSSTQPQNQSRLNPIN